MQPFFSEGNITIFNGDCREVLADMPDNSIDAIVTDPPYGLNFMGQKWDRLGDTSANYTNLDKPHSSQEGYPMNKSRGRPISETDGPKQQEWHLRWAMEALRVLKPGGHLLAFGGSRTYHRMACAIEDAGFEIRDQIMWLYGSGFPKSLDVSKAIDKAARGVPQGGSDPTSPNHGNYKGGCSEDNPSGRGFGAGPGQFMKDGREIIGMRKGKGGQNLNSLARPDGNDSDEARGCGAYGFGAKQVTIDIPITAPATEAAKQWSGWGTALKPAHEPICVARKPLEGTVATNVQKYGTGAINIDECRVGTTKDIPASPSKHLDTRCHGKYGDENEVGVGSGFDPNTGRWPANVLHDGSEEVVSLFPQTASASVTSEIGGYDGEGVTGFIRGRSNSQNQRADSGSAARFFYTAKADKGDREDTMDGDIRNDHPTVKPTDLMKYLCKLVTPPNGIILDPFSGSGSTLVAAQKLGFKAIGIEIDEKYCKIAEKRLAQQVFDFQ